MGKQTKMESSQQLKKLQRTKLDDAPKKAPSAYALYRSEVMKTVVEANKGMSCGELGKKIAAMWAEVSDDKKASYTKESERLRVEYERKLKDFKKKDTYADFLARRRKVKERENKMVNLREMPKRPKSVFALFAAEHKGEGDTAKGKGKGSLKKKF